MPDYNKIFLQGIARLEKRYVLSIVKAITSFRSSFITQYTADPSTALSALNFTFLSQDITEILLSIYRNAGLFGARLSAQEIKEQAKLKAAGLGRNEQWIRDVLDFLNRSMLGLISDITETMREDVTKVIAQAIDEGWSIDQIVKELKNTSFIEARARVIARTEIVRAANVGHSVAAESLPYLTDKKWNAASDHRTRHSHQAINGHIVDEADTFKVAIYKGDKIVGYDNMLYPGDATAHPSNTINCRCRVTYIPKRDSQGKLVFRQAETAKIIPLRNPSTTIPAHQIAAALKANIFIGVKLGDGTEQ